MNEAKAQQGRNWSFRFSAEEFAWIDEQRRLLPDPSVAAYIRKLIAEDRERSSGASGTMKEYQPPYLNDETPDGSGSSFT